MRRKENTALIEATREEAARLLQSIAEPVFPGEKPPSRIERAAKILGWRRVRTGKIWRMEARRIDVHEMDQLRREVRERVK